MKLRLSRVKQLIGQRRSHLRREFGLKTVGVFGSVARGDTTFASDIDLLVEFTQPISYFKFADLENELGQLLGARVDLVTPKALKPAVKDNILKDVRYV